MTCDKCGKQMKLKNYREYGIHTIYYWKCKHCGHEKQTTESK